MALRSMTVHRYEEIRRRLAEGRGLREIARALGCSRRTVREVRDGERLSPDAPRSPGDPLWMAQLDWPTIIHDLGLGHPLKFLCALPRHRGRRRSGDGRADESLEVHRWVADHSLRPEPAGPASASIFAIPVVRVG
jgi:hypothetical protein